MSISVIVSIILIALSPIVSGLELDNFIPLKEFDISARVDTLSNVPTVFTPNGDGENDVFLPRIDSLPVYDKYVFKIFNRWGELLFESNDPYVGWDGTSGKKEIPAGTYVWLIEIKISRAEKLKYHGHVTLLR